MAQHRDRTPGNRSHRGQFGPPARSGTSGPAARPGSDLVALRAQLMAVVGPVVAGSGYDLEDLGVSRVGRRHLLRIVVDADGGVSLDAVAEVSRKVSEALDAAEKTDGELIAGEYQLEVSSPGVDRPLTEPRHWRRARGRLVRAPLASGAPGYPGTVQGRVTEARADGVTLDVGGRLRDFAYPDLGPGQVQVEFGPPAGPGAADDEPGDEGEPDGH